MSTWLFEGALSIALFLALMPLVIVPFLGAVFRRYHYLAPGPTLLAGATGLYACALIGFTTFPLPDSGDDLCERNAPYEYWRLQPGRSFEELRQHFEQVGLTSTLSSGFFLQIAFNVVFFLPLGFLIAYYLRQGVLAAALGGLGVSLLIETTQGTGLWFLYPCPYRVAEFDDLITNTSGALLGWGLGWLIARRWPYRQPEPRPDPGPPTVLRRMGASALDLLLLLVGTTLIDILVAVVQASMGNVDPDSPWFTASQYAVGVALLLAFPAIGPRRSTPGQQTLLLTQASARKPTSATSELGVLIRFAVRWLPIIVFGMTAVLVLLIVESVTVLTRRDHLSLADLASRSRTETFEEFDSRQKADDRPSTAAHP